jgi:hypothetical protein
VKVHHITALGVDLIVLPPDAFLCDICKSPAGTPNEHNWCDGCTVPAVGDVVDGDIECPTCDDGLVAGYDYDSGVPTGVCCEDCDGDGTVSVPHEVVAVVPLVANFEGATMPNAVLLVTETGVEWWGCGDNEAHHLADLVLPDAEPGGVCLLVEPQP